MNRFFRRNGLTLVLLAMFAGAFVGQVFSGFHEFNDERQEHEQPAVSFGDYLGSSHLWEAATENWESEFLQMFVYIVLTAVLYQKGSAESKDPDKPEEPGPPVTERSPYPVRRGGWLLALYRHSLSGAFAALFLASWALHAVAGARIYNEEQVGHGGEAVSTWDYTMTSRFWFESMQNWQSEFLSIALMVVFTIWLREHGSPESKPVEMAHADNQSRPTPGRPATA